MVTQRDKEISRLNNLFMGADNLDKMHIQFIEKDNAETIAKLNSQLDYINKENNRLHQTISDLRMKNKGNTGMYLENKKVVDKIEVLKKENDDLKRINSTSEAVISSLKEREGELIVTLGSQIPVKKYEEALKTIECQQLDIEKLKKLLEIQDNQKTLQTHMQIASNSDTLDYLPEKERMSMADQVKLTAEREKLLKKNEQFRNEINALSGRYLSSQRKLEFLTSEYKELKVKVGDLETSNQVLRDELDHKEKEIEVMIEYLKEAQPMALKEKENSAKAANSPKVYFAETPKDQRDSKESSSKDPQKTKKMFENVAHFGKGE